MPQIEVPAGQTPAQASGYGYQPSQNAAIVFLVLFVLTALVHTFQGIRGKYWIIFPTLVTGAIIEAIGWGGRLWSSQDIMEDTPFLMQICCLIMAPVFFSAYNYTTIGMAIGALGPTYSLLTPKWYLIIFLGVDTIALILQAVGGGMAASAETEADANVGQNIMLAGIVFQLVSMIFFVIIGTDFITRVMRNKPYAFRVRNQTTALSSPSSNTLAPANSDASIPEKTGGEAVQARQNMTRWWIFLIAGVGISSLAIIIRGLYRTAELSEGWGGPIMLNENLQNFLDGLPMIIAVAIFNFVNPTYLLPKRSSWKGIH